MARRKTDKKNDVLRLETERMKTEALDKSEGGMFNRRD